MAGERASDPRESAFLSPLDRFEAVAPRFNKSASRVGDYRSSQPHLPTEGKQ
jgi:hypothetical protein